MSQQLNRFQPNSLWVILMMIALIIVVLSLSTQVVHAATINVTTTNVTFAGDGQCSLSEAIDNANMDAAFHPDCGAGAGTDTIVLQSGATYTIIPGTESELFVSPTATLGLNGLPPINSEMRITGNGAIIERSDVARFNFRIFFVTGRGNLTLDDVTVRQGDAGNSNGGAIFAWGQVNVQNSTFSNNQGRNGGAIHTFTTLDVSGSTFSNNVAADGGGGAIFSRDRNLTITDSEITDNRALEVPSGGPRVVGRGDGGGILVAQNRAVITRTRIVRNEAIDDGGGLYINDATVFLNDTTINNNHSTVSGGGVYNLLGQLSLMRTTLALNTAQQGGGLYTFSSRADIVNITINDSIIRDNTATMSGGGGVFDSGLNAMITIEMSTISGNSALGAAGHGGGLHVRGAAVTIRNADIANNIAQGDGGGAFNDGGVFSIRDTTVTNNEADGNGGALATNNGAFLMQDDTITGNTADLDGGALWAAMNGRILMVQSLLADNTAFGDGGGLWHFGDESRFLNTTVSGNRATNGAGIRNIGFISIEGTTFVNNRASNDGGAIHHSEGLVTMTNSTLSNNRAVGQGGGFVNYANSSLSFVTITLNRASRGAGIAHPGGILRIDNLWIRSSIVGDNMDSTDCFGSSGLNAIGQNLASDRSCNGFTLANLAPRLQDLNNNGGWTRTHGLRPASPAVDAADACRDAIDTLDIGIDQRGIRRPQGVACDLGAFEREVPTSTTSGELPEGAPCLINNELLGSIPVRLGPGLNRAVAGFLPAVQNLEVIGQNEESDDSPLHYLLPSDLFGPNSPYSQLWVQADLVIPFGNCATLAIVTPGQPQGQTTTTFGDADCNNFAATSPLEGFPQGNVTFFWNPAPDATSYVLTIRNLDANTTVFSQNVAAPTTSLTTDVSTAVIGVGFSFEYEVQAFINGQVMCSDTVRILRESPPPDQPAPPPPQPMCGNGIQEPGENPNNCPNGY